jgi:hypothetical protein
MKINLGSSFIIGNGTWSEVRDLTLSKSLALQYVYDTSNPSYSPFFHIFSIDNPIVYQTRIYNGSVPPISDTNQIDNDNYKTDFLNNWISSSVQTINFRVIDPMSVDDPRVSHIFGNMTTGSVMGQELLVSARVYNPPASEGQRSVSSTSANDANPGGSGAKIVRIAYLNSDYQRFVEDVALNGTTAVNTVNTNIRFIDSFSVIAGAAAAGVIRIHTNTGGTGTSIAQVGAGTTNAFLCHHYVPTGSKAYVLGWGTVTDYSASMKLTIQSRISGNLIDQIADLQRLHPETNLGAIAGTIPFYRNLKGVMSDEATYIRITAVPYTPVTLTIRSYLDIWEVKK